MATCPNCNKELNEGAKFCDGCGTKLIETIFCPECGNQIGADSAFCQTCGASLTEAPAIETAPQESAEEPAQEAAEIEAPQAPAQDVVQIPVMKKALPKKALIFGGIGIAVIALLAVVIALFSGGKKANFNYVLYFKDKEIFYNNLKADNKSLQMTSHLVDSSDEVSNSDFNGVTYSLANYIYVSKDGKTVFFPDKISGDGDGLNLYYRSTDDAEAEAVKVDSDVQSYYVNDDVTVVTYLKGDDGDLYQYNIKKDEKNKLATDVQGFMVSTDGNRIGYMTDENNIYYKDGDMDAEKLASDVSSLVHADADLTVGYYVKDETLYMHKVGQDRVKIDSNVTNTLKIYDSGEMYYFKTSDQEILLKNFVNDDIKEADEAITQPTYPSYPYYWDYNTTAEYNAAYEAYKVAYEKYQEDYAKYQEKLDRDDLREKLLTWTMKESVYTLYFFNGEESTKITDNYIYGKSSCAADAPVIAYSAYSQTEVGKVNLSEIESVYNVETKVRNALTASSETYIAIGAVANKVDLNNISSITFNKTGTMAYFCSVAAEENHGDLYRMPIKNDKLEAFELYDSEVFSYLRLLDNGSVCYYKNCSNQKGDLYIDKNAIDYDVYVYSLKYDSGNLYYYTDYNIEKFVGTLNIYNGKEKTKVSDDTFTYTLTSDGRVLYLYDYSTDHFKGELREWKNGESRKLDDDVVYVVPYSNNSIRGSYYGW